jgi:steroid 5-alpha reductase family enzyme
MSPFCLLITIAGLLAAVMAAGWVVARRPGQSAWTDVFWTFGIGTAGVLAALAPDPRALLDRQLLVAALVTFWALRLGLHIAARTRKHGEDPRYAALRSEWGASFDLRLFLFLQIQAAAALLLVISILLAAHNPAPGLGWGDGLGALILLAAIIGEGVADRQLEQFRGAKAGRICDTGLWGWSRHPNYFFEWLGWTAYALIALAPAAASGWAWLALIGPAFMYLLLVYVSGVPPLEAHMLKSRGDAFRAYQARVPAFWPMPPIFTKGDRR